MRLTAKDFAIIERLRAMLPQLVYDVSADAADVGAKIYGKPRFYFKGVANNCSACCVTQLSSAITSLSDVRKSVSNAWLVTLKAWKEAKTMQEVFDQLHNPYERLPKEFAYAYVLEAMYKKTTTGDGTPHQVGGNDSFKLFAREDYTTSLWMMSDNKKSGRDEVRLLKFMTWLAKQKLGSMTMSKWAIGAHGGYVRGAMYIPDLTRVKQFLEETVQKANEHAEALRLLPGIKVTGAPVQDEVSLLW